MNGLGEVVHYPILLCTTVSIRNLDHHLFVSLRGVWSVPLFQSGALRVTHSTQHAQRTQQTAQHTRHMWFCTVRVPFGFRGIDVMSLSPTTNGLIPFHIVSVKLESLRHSNQRQLKQL